jgi:hypothetical protein
MLLDVAIPGDRNAIQKEAEKILKYKDLTIEIQRMWNVKTTVIRSSSIDLTRLSGPRSRPTTTQKNLVAPGIEPGTSVSVARNSDQ